MKLPDLAPLSSPEPPPDIGSLLQWGRGVSSFLKRLTGRQNETVNAEYQLAAGQRQLCGTKTLTASAASTTISDDALPSGAIVFLFPRTANAAAALATTYQSASAKGSITLTHANNAQTDKTFNWVAFVPA